jgi:hypothetical protein
MALSYAQIVALSCQVAKCPGFTSQAGQLLNNILNDLCENYDLGIASSSYAFQFNTSINGGAGPFPLPADFLRSAINDTIYYISGVPYIMTAIDNNEYDAMVQTPGLQSYPTFYSVWFDTVSVGGTPYMKVWVPASGAYPVKMRYYRMMPVVATPETDATIPWFPAQSYLRNQLTGELCQLTGDDRWEMFLSDIEEQHPNGSGVLLRKYLKMKDDQANRVKTVTRDRRRFGSNFSQLPNTKVVGW